MTSDRMILYTSRYLLPITGPPVKDGALLAAEGRIRAVGARGALVTAHPAAAVVDFGDAVMLPPMVNAHAHLELTAFADWAKAAGEDAPPGDFVDWILRLVQVRRQVTVDQVRSSLAAGLEASLRAGTGAVGDICSTLEASAVYGHTPLYGRVFAEVLGHDAELVSGRLAMIRALFGQPPGPALTWGLSPHAPYTLSATTLPQVFAFVAEHAHPCAIHLAESAHESQLVREGRGLIADKLYAAAQWHAAGTALSGSSPVQALCRAGFLRQGTLVVHGVHVDAADREQLRRAGCHVVLCPRSNAALDVGVAPAAEYLQAGVSVCLGTDSLASAPSLSLWEELAFARNRYGTDIAPHRWLEIATLGGARALGLQHRIGRLAIGQDASFQVVRLPVLPAAGELAEALCVAGDSVEVTHLYLGSRNVLP